ncbi:hypothetical protein FA15DRAFT_665347, partial [Coprinopsis marcescibilis]
MPTLTLFQNRNTNFSYTVEDAHDNDEDDREEGDEYDDDDDVRSCLTTTETVESTTSAESDFIPFIPLVLQYERGMLHNGGQTRGGGSKMALDVSQAGGTYVRARTRSAVQSSRGVDAPVLRTCGTTYTPPSPTPSSNEGSLESMQSASLYSLNSASTQSPITPQTPVFTYEDDCGTVTPPISVCMDGEDDGTSTGTAGTTVDGVVTVASETHVSGDKKADLLSASRSRTLSPSSTRTSNSASSYFFRSPLPANQEDKSTVNPFNSVGSRSKRSPHQSARAFHAYVSQASKSTDVAHHSHHSDSAKPEDIVDVDGGVSRGGMEGRELRRDNDPTCDEDDDGGDRARSIFSIATSASCYSMESLDCGRIVVEGGTGMGSSVLGRLKQRKAGSVDEDEEVESEADVDEDGDFETARSEIIGPAQPVYDDGDNDIFTWASRDPPDEDASPASAPTASFPLNQAFLHPPVHHRVSDPTAQRRVKGEFDFGPFQEGLAPPPASAPPRRRSEPCLPDITIEAASVAEETTTGEDMSRSSTMLYPYHRAPTLNGGIVKGDMLGAGLGGFGMGMYKKYQQKIGVGRQTVDPRTLRKGRSAMDVGAGVTRVDEKSEWTLFLGVREEEVESRTRPRTKSTLNQLPEAQQRQRQRQVSERSRTKSMKRAAPPAVELGPFSAVDEDDGIPPPPSSPPPIPVIPVEVQKPLHRILPMPVRVAADELVASESEDDYGKVVNGGRGEARREHGHGLRRSGSAMPILGGSRTDELEVAPQDADWTLMLPLPNTKPSRARLPIGSVTGLATAPSTVNGRRGGDTTMSKSSRSYGKNIKKARSSAELSPRMDSSWAAPGILDSHRQDKMGMGRRDKVEMPFESLKTIKKELEKIEKVSTRLENARRRREATGAGEEDERLLAALVDYSRESSLDEPRSDGWDEDVRSEELLSEKDREDHRKIALEALSGRSTSASPAYSDAVTALEEMDVSSLPRRKNSQESNKFNSGTDSSGSSEMRFVTRLDKLLDGNRREVFGGVDPDALVPETRPVVALPVSFRNTKKDQSPAVNTLVPPSSPPVPTPPTTPPPKQNVNRLVSKAVLCPFPSVSHSPPASTRIPHPFAAAKPVGFPPASTLVTPDRHNSLSLSSRAPIGPSKAQGWSFSQYGGQPPAVASTSIGKRPATSSGSGRHGFQQGSIGNGFGGFTNPFGAPTAPVAPVARPKAATFPQSTSPRPAAPIVPLAVKKDFGVADEDGEAGRRDSAFAETMSISSKSSDSSTDTIVLPGSRRGSGDENTCSSFGEQKRSLVVDEAAGSLVVPERERRVSACSTVASFDDGPFDLDFPMPPTFHPAMPPMRKSSESDGPTVRHKPSISRLDMTPSPDLHGAAIEALSPVLGRDEDEELPPPTPLTPVEQRTIRVTLSPRNSPQKSPPQVSPSRRPLIHPVTVLDAVHPSASGWIEDEDEDEDEYGTDTDTIYEDAMSVLEEEYEDAMSMLSGVFYSARTSIDS